MGEGRGAEVRRAASRGEGKIDHAVGSRTLVRIVLIVFLVISRFLLGGGEANPSQVPELPVLGSKESRVRFGRDGYFVVERYEGVRVVRSTVDEKGKRGQPVEEEDAKRWKALLDGGISFYLKGFCGERVAVAVRVAEEGRTTDRIIGAPKTEKRADFRGNAGY